MHNLPVSLETVATDFASSLESYVQTIIDAAETRASEIAREAEKTAHQKEEDAERRAQEILDAVVTRTTRLLGSIELVESSLRGMIGGLRAELETMTTDLAEQQHIDVLQVPQADSALEQPVPPAGTDADGASAPEPDTIEPTAEPPATAATPEPAASNLIPEPPASTLAPDLPANAPPAEQSVGNAGAVQAGDDEPRGLADSVSEAAQPAESEPIAGPEETSSAEPEDSAMSPDARPGNGHVDTPTDAAAEFDQMIHAKIREMVQSGKPRKDVERFLRRFKRGKQYIDQLDGIFAEHAHAGLARQRPRRRRLWHRR